MVYSVPSDTLICVVLLLAIIMTLVIFVRSDFDVLCFDLVIVEFLISTLSKIIKILRDVSRLVFCGSDGIDLLQQFGIRLL
mgnify:CR=1 FL=1